MLELCYCLQITQGSTFKTGKKSTWNSLCVSRPDAGGELTWFVEQTAESPTFIPILSSTARISLSPSQLLLILQNQFTCNLLQSLFRFPLPRRIQFLFFQTTLFRVLFNLLAGHCTLSFYDFLPDKIRSTSRAGPPPPSEQRCPITGLHGSSLPLHWGLCLECVPISHSAKFRSVGTLELGWLLTNTFSSSHLLGPMKLK